MSYGGPTWDDAGTLTLGDNTFDFAGITETGGPNPYMRAWWSFSPPSDGVYVIDTGATTSSGFSPDTMIYVYTGATEGAKVYVTSDDDSGPGNLAVLTVTLLAGVTYRVLVGTYGPGGGGIETYHVSLTRTTSVIRRTDWLDTFRDRDDNQIIVSNESNTLNENPWPEWRTSQAWYDTVLNGASDQRAPGRRGRYNIQGELPGWTSLLSGADACAWAHAVNGDFSVGNTFWNTSTDNPDDNGPPTCRPLGEGGIDQDFNSTYRVLQYSPPGFLTAGAMLAEVRHTALTPAFRFAEANVHERGALPFTLVDPEADGVPAEYVDFATFEWEPGGVELVSIEASGDANGADIDPADAVTFLINPSNAPVYTGGGTYSTWPKGIPASADSIHYEDGLDWNALPISGFDDVAADGPDMVVVAALDVALDDAPPDFREVYGVGKLAYRFTFRSPRYRWTWVEENTTVVRQWPRDDARGVSSAPRLWPPSKSRRLAGGYPGGSNA